MFNIKKNHKRGRKKKNKNKLFSFPRLFAYSFAIIAIVQSLSLGLSLRSPEMAMAASNEPTTYTMQVPIPGIGDNGVITFSNDTGAIANYVKGIYNYAVGIVGILAAIMLMVGGFRWILAGGNASSISEAKAMIFAAISGLVLVMTSYIILSQVNPALTEFRITTISNPNVIETQKQEAYSNLGACNWREEKNPNQSSEQFTIVQEETCNSFKSVLSSDQNCTASKPTSNDLASYKCCCEYNRDSNTECSWMSSFDSCTGENTPYTGNEGIKKCGSSGYASTNTCCCKAHSFNNLTCQGSVCQQKKDADDSLISTLDCLGGKLTGVSVKISSISDNHLLSNDWSYCTTEYPGQCKNNSSDSKKCCYHTINSCHYGGGVEGKEKSFAVDLVGDKATIEKIANQYKEECGIGYVLDEDDHIHISTKYCRKQ